MFSPRLTPLGDAALQIHLGTRIDPLVNGAVHALAEAVRDWPGIQDRVPAYASLTLHFDPMTWDSPTLGERLAPLLDQLAGLPLAGRLREIPVCYGGEYGPDLEEVAIHCRLSPAEVIARHSASEYRVYFLGFTPGFPYLGGLPESLATPRRAIPRPQLPAGSVGIAGQQTGIYPQATPGGWQIIGRTPQVLFDRLQDPPCWLAPGDRLRFVPIPVDAFAGWEPTP